MTPSATFFTFCHHLFPHFWLGLLRSFSYCKKAPLPRNKDELRSFSHRVWTNFGRIEAVSGRTCPGFPLASGRIFVTGGRGCDFSSESLRYVGSCARQFCKLCPISFDIIAKFFLTCCTAHLKAAPIVGFDPIRIGIESESNRTQIQYLSIYIKYRMKQSLYFNHGIHSQFRWAKLRMAH